ncbi:NAD/NADP-dependent betaine aldehyde dehydrogenase [Pseudomonas sp. Teo4]|nr:NAD/NADP-dependent betaine aldehyde dehydrogenase [Pseudomonas sp. Teo4]
MLYRIAGLIRERAEELAQLQRQDNGKPIAETRALVASAAGTFQFFAAACETLEETITPSRGDFVSMSVYEPMGVVAAITPWNSPIASEAQKVAPALAGGNAVVIKPAEITPLLALQLARICEDAGLPKGLISVLPGKGSLLGDALTRHPLVKRVSFTGGTRTGKHIAHIAADKMMPVSLELGGKSPTIVLDDADLDHAVAGVLYGIFSSSGEACIAGSRLFVAHALYEPFMARLTAAAAQLRVGDPADERTQMGPLISAAHRESVERYVAWALPKVAACAWVASAPVAGCSTKAISTRRPSLKAWATTSRSARKKSSARCWWPCRSTAKSNCSNRPTTACTPSPLASGAVTTSAPGRWAASFRPARCGSTPTSSSPFRPRSAAGATAAWAAKRAAWASCSTWNRKASTGA